MIDESLLSFEEKCTYKLRALYTKYGYLPYKMGKFEEYELYIRNKDFLVSDRVIAFNDTNGKLMALKPDVTLSIIKNGEDAPGVKQKVFYNENVYRVSESTHRFKEIMQTGLECIGDVDIYDICECISLAAESLGAIADDFCIEVSNLDLLRGVISSVCANEEFAAEAIACISEKNRHDLKTVCEKYGVDEDGQEKIGCLVSVYGERKSVIGKLREVFSLPEIERMATLSEMLDNSVFADKIKFDFSVVNDMNYYNGFVFRGFVDGGCRRVLAGGPHDNMMKKMKRTSGAIGFAVYLDRMDDLFRESEKYDVDTLLLYDDETDAAKVASSVRSFVASGSSVSAQKSIPEKLRYKKIADLRKKG
ncbi:MAG: ATP phosphoribosyltransferase regulatory subunit [Clostridia bacterium]|nr:ATP phosphoribosyltransferase regulatory subunit [Clostridia bacterium]